jgi:hypothetical protein
MSSVTGRKIPLKVYRKTTTRVTTEEPLDKVPKFIVGDHVNIYGFGTIDEGKITDVRYRIDSDYGEAFDYMINNEWTPESIIESYSPDNIIY